MERSLNLWATWCEPCREELPALNHLRRDAGPPLRKFTAQHPFQTLNVYTSRLGWFDIPGWPVILVIDR